jgi:hypothetical protein
MIRPADAAPGVGFAVRMVVVDEERGGGGDSVPLLSSLTKKKNTLSWPCCWWLSPGRRSRSPVVGRTGRDGCRYYCRLEDWMLKRAKTGRCATVTKDASLRTERKQVFMEMQ